VLFDSWVDEELEGLELVDFVMENSMRVEELREESSLKLRKNGEERKKKWDLKAKDREFKENDEVLMRKAGLNGKLETSWNGPFRIVKKNSPLSYRVDMGDREVPSVHISLLKSYEREKESVTVARATTVIEGDVEGDEIEGRYTEVKVSGEGELDAKKRSQVDEVLGKFENTLTKQPGLTSITTFKIDTGTNPPARQRPYSIPVHFRQSIDKEIDWLLEQGFIRPSSSLWASPIMAVKKPDGSARLCVDYKRLNAVTVDQPFYMPRVEEVLEGVGQARWVSKLDLSKGYYQVQVAPEDIKKTSFVCHKGQFEFTRMPFGVKNAPAIFQTIMQNIFAEQTNCIPYMDDLVIFSNTWEEHLVHIQHTLQLLEDAGLSANPSKCVWGGRQIEFLGHKVGGGKMSIPAHRVEAFAKYSKPSTKKGVRSFLGAVSFYRRYIHRLASQTAILTQLTSKLAPAKVVWTREGELAF